MALTKTRTMYSDLQYHVTSTSYGSDLHSYSQDLRGDTPILLLIHGYPQSAYIWRYIVPAFATKMSLFVPELPGYGISSPCTEHHKKAVGSAIIEALVSCFKIEDGQRRRVIVCAHDRGARVGHRIVVDKDDYPRLNLLGTILIDITPSKAQWDKFTTPAVATAFFHWPLFSNAEIATDIIQGYGPTKWLEEVCLRLVGTNEVGRQKIRADDAIELYGELFNNRDVIYQTCLDYKAGGEEDYALQAEDQARGKKIAIPTIVVFSDLAWGGRQDVDAMWRDWITDGVPYECVALKDGYGHYLPEEASDDMIRIIGDLFSKVA